MSMFALFYVLGTAYAHPAGKQLCALHNAKYFLDVFNSRTCSLLLVSHSTCTLNMVTFLGVLWPLVELSNYFFWHISSSFRVPLQVP